MKKNTVLITGSAGLIGTAVARRLTKLGHDVIGIDIQPSASGELIDVCNIAAHSGLFLGVQGVIHLAAVSRVIDAQMDPIRCQRVNVEGTRAILQVIGKQVEKPWFIYASSREVYGEQTAMPVPETAPLQPLNVYARSKVAAETITTDARKCGINTAIVRFSNVFGSTDDHETRVVPAFVRRALNGQPLFVEGENNTFDFTFVEDVSAGVVALATHLCSGLLKPHPIHFVTGRETSLRALADMIVSITQSSSSIVERPARTFDVSKFCGDPTLAAGVLNWRAGTSLEDALSLTVQNFREHYGANPVC